MKTICVIQARLGSTRLPGKVLMPLGGKPMLQNIVERLRRCKKIDEIVVAWPIKDFDRLPKDKWDVSHFFYQGDENDLIGRFLECAKVCRADWVVRVCSDNPVVEANEIDKLVVFKDVYPPLLLNSENPERDHDGFGGEIYSKDTLKWMDETIKLDKYREHPHQFWIEFGGYGYYLYFGHQYPRGFRLDVNTPADYKKLSDIYDHFGYNQFSAREALKYLEQKNLEERHIPAGIGSGGQCL